MTTDESISLSAAYKLPSETNLPGAKFPKFRWQWKKEPSVMHVIMCSAREYLVRKILSTSLPVRSERGNFLVKIGHCSVRWQTKNRPSIPLWIWPITYIHDVYAYEYDKCVHTVYSTCKALRESHMHLLVITVGRATSVDDVRTTHVYSIQQRLEQEPRCESRYSSYISECG